MNKGSNSSHISVKNTCDYLSQLKAQADEERSSTTAGYISNTATEDQFMSLTRQYHYDENANQVPNRARDSENRGTSASRISDGQYRSDVLIYDAPVSKDRVTFGTATKREDEVYHSHMIHVVSGRTSRDLYNGVNHKVEKTMIKTETKIDDSKFKDVSQGNDSLISFVQPWTSNSGGSDNIQKQAKEASRELASAARQREEYKSSHKSEFTNAYAKELQSVIAKEDVEKTSKMSTSELKAARDKVIDEKLNDAKSSNAATGKSGSSGKTSFVSSICKSVESHSEQPVKQSISESARTVELKHDSVTSRVPFTSCASKVESETIKDAVTSKYDREETTFEKVEQAPSSFSFALNDSYNSDREQVEEDRTEEDTIASCKQIESSYSNSYCDEKEDKEEDHSYESEMKRSSCSWWYHGRCLQNEDDCYNCSSYDSCPHNCSNCSSFCSEAGSNRNGDSWYGICEAYGGNPIRHDPSSHTCKAWN